MILNSVKITVFIFMAAVMSLTVSADDAEALLVDTEIAKIIDAIPDGADDDLPDEVLTGDASALDAKFIFGKVAEAMKNELTPSLRLLSRITAILLISTSARLLSGGRCVDIISCLAIGAEALAVSMSLVGGLEIYIGTLSAFMGAIAPVYAALLTAASNTRAAAVSSSGFMLAASAVGFAVDTVLVPLCRICLSMSVISSVASDSGTSEICRRCRKLFVSLSALCAFLFTTVMSYQSSIAAAADSAVMKGVKYAVGSSVPVVGGALGDAVRMTAASLNVIKNSAGAIGIAVLILISAPIIIKLMMNRAALGAASCAARLLGCDREAGFLLEVSEVSGFMISSSAIVFAVFVSSVAIFMKTSPALTA